MSRWEELPGKPRHPPPRGRRRRGWALGIPRPLAARPARASSQPCAVRVPWNGFTLPNRLYFISATPFTRRSPPHLHPLPRRLVQRCGCAWHRAPMAMFSPISPPRFRAPWGQRPCSACFFLDPINILVPVDSQCAVIPRSPPEPPSRSGALHCAGKHLETFLPDSPRSPLPTPPRPAPAPLMDDGEIGENQYGRALCPGCPQ